MNNLLKLLVGFLMVLLLGACGGGGGSPGATPGSAAPGGAAGPVPGTVPAPTPARIELFASASQLSSAVGSSVTFTVTVKDESNRSIPGQPVTFTVDSGNLAGALPSPSTGAAGEPITSVSLSPGTDASNRDILVTAVAGSITKTITVPVQGTSLTLAGDSSVVFGANATFTAKALDSGGRPLTGATLNVTSALGNAVTPQRLVTDAQGAATFKYAGAAAGRDTVTVTGLGTTVKAPISVSSDDFRFVSPAASSTVPVGGAQTLTVRYTIAGVPAAGRAITFSSTRGTVFPSSATTDANGVASTVLSSSISAGPATVIAQAETAQATLPILFAATTPVTLVLQANPGTVPPNLSGTGNQIALQATVRDATGNPVPNRTVNFSAVTDGSNGVISPGSGVTDANGSVVAQFIPGALTTSTNGVEIMASVQGTSVSGSTKLTVSGQSLFISIASNNEISNLNPSTYQKEFSVYVTDATGAAVANRSVVMSVYADRYGKGTLVFPKGAKSWTYNLPISTCPNEDELSTSVNARRNGILDAGEDVNGDGRLNPGLPVVVTPGTVTTGANGIALFYLQYGENFANWVDTTITARAVVGGTESVQTAAFSLAASVGDMTNESVPPASVVSPFGTLTCTDPN